MTALRRRLSAPSGPGLDTPAGRRRHMLHFHLFDHAFLRMLWTNFDKVGEGVYRSNQPSPARMKRLKARGIRTVLSLRGDKPMSFNLLEREAADKLGITLVSIRLYAKRVPSVETLIALEELFNSLEKPLLIHCKSGADRAGFASALYLLMVEKRTVAEAARQLHWRYLHRKTTWTGVLDHFLEAYDIAYRKSGISLMDWVRTEYDPDAVMRSFQCWLAVQQGEPKPTFPPKRRPAPALPQPLSEAEPVPFFPCLAEPDVKIEAKPDHRS
ncbi:tyrosine-protein phosphatase [Frigidibacter albus]